MKQNGAHILLAATVLATMCGCASIASLREDYRTGKPDHAKQIYGGVREDWETMTSSWRGPSWSKPFSIVSAIDIPFCMVVDTVALPFTIPYNIVQSRKEKNAANQAFEAIGDPGSPQPQR